MKNRKRRIQCAKKSGIRLTAQNEQENHTAIKNFNNCLQIAHLMSQLLTLAKNTSVKIYKSIRKLWEYFTSLLRIMEDYVPLKPTNRKYNTRY